MWRSGGRGGRRAALIAAIVGAGAPAASSWHDARVVPEPMPAAFETLAAELRELLPDRSGVLDAHTHLGLDEDGQSLTLESLLAFLDQVDPGAKACVFALHDPDRRPAYRRPNDRVLEWAAQADGRLFPFCRLDPAEDPVAEGERCLALGARGIKLHPRAQSFGFAQPAASAIFELAAQAGVPILIHAGRGMGRMDDLADLALRHPDAALVLAHAGIADQAMFATRLADHPAVVYDTSCFSAYDVIELFARVPAERIVFASDVPYGRPVGGLYQTMRVAAYAGLDQRDLRPRRFCAGPRRIPVADLLENAALARGAARRRRRRSRRIGSQPTSVFLKNPVALSQASFAADASKRGVVSLLKPCCAPG